MSDVAQRLVLTIVSVVMLVVAACAPEIEAPPPAAKPTAQLADKPAPKVEQIQPSGWEDEWARVVEAAQREGQVVLAGPQGSERRDALTERFQETYGITVHYSGFTAELGPRVTAEREAGQFLWDVFIGGSSTGLDALVPLGALDPLEPLLILPEVRDTEYWREGRHDFVDDQGRILRMVLSHGATIFINTELVNADEFTSHKDLLDAKWKGRMIANDPRIPGPGQGTFAFFYRHPDLGLDFIRALAGQELTLSRDLRQELDSLGQGRFPILIGGSDGIAEDLIRVGLPIGIVEPGQLREGTDIRSAPGYLAVFNRRPNPNATALYINWLLSQEGQTFTAPSIGHLSRRLDVSTDHTFAWRIPSPDAITTEDAAGLEARREMRAHLEELFGGS